MRQVQAVTPGEIPRLTICEVLVELEYSTKCKTNYLDTGTNELPCALAYILQRISHHNCWKSLCWNL